MHAFVDHIRTSPGAEKRLSADADAGIAFGYTPNYMHDELELGPRGAALVGAVFDCL